MNITIQNFKKRKKKMGKRGLFVIHSLVVQIPKEQKMTVYPNTVYPVEEFKGSMTLWCYHTS